ncbi:MAG: DUF2188 domain-containing protein [Deltaproteobacteria bacterium]|nr:DUF2188 domain-containing protein [Deltaproteobacteria bacterium]
MAARAHHVVPNHETGGWDVKAEGHLEPIRHFGIKEQAVDFARDLSRTEHTELLIHDKQGRIEERDSYRV